MSIRLATAVQPLLFRMVDSSNHYSGKTGLAPTVAISKNGGAFVTPAGAVTELANGWYKVAANTVDSNTLGPLVLYATATGADQCNVTYDVVAFDPQDSTRMGLASLPNAAAGASNGLRVGAPQEFAPIAGTIQVGTYAPVPSSGTAVFYDGGGGAEVFFDGGEYRVFVHPTTITGCKLYVPTPQAPAVLTSIILRIWRQNGGGTFDLVGQSNDFIGQIVAGQINTVTFSAPINGVQEGDYYSIFFTQSTAGLTPFYRTFYVNSAPAESCNTYFYNASGLAPNTFDWRNAATFSFPGWGVGISLLGPVAPAIGYMGDSYTAGFPLSYGPIWNAVNPANDFADAFERVVQNVNGLSYCNMGIYAQTTTQMLARFTADILNRTPRLLILGGMRNDVTNAISTATTESNVASMVSQATSAGIQTIVWTTPGDASLTAAQSRLLDTLNAYVRTLPTLYPLCSVVDLVPLVNQFRGGGDAGNLWDHQGAYNYSDNVHLSLAGYLVVGRALASAVNQVRRTNYALTTAEHAKIAADAQAGLTAQGYTTARAPNLDNLDATVSSRAKPADVTLTVTPALSTTTPVGVTNSSPLTAYQYSGFSFTLPALDSNGNSLAITGHTLKCQVYDTTENQNLIFLLTVGSGVTINSGSSYTLSGSPSLTTVHGTYHYTVRDETSNILLATGAFTIVKLPNF